MVVERSKNCEPDENELDRGFEDAQDKERLRGIEEAAEEEE